MKPFFEAKDFEKCILVSDFSHNPYKKFAIMCNERLEREGVRVFGVVPPGEEKLFWFQNNSEPDTHTAILINIQPIEKKECEHGEVNREHGQIVYRCGFCKERVRPRNGWEVIP
jgi:hypothetical protein